MDLDGGEEREQSKASGIEEESHVDKIEEKKQDVEEEETKVNAVNENTVFFLILWKCFDVLLDVAKLSSSWQLQLQLN